MSQEEKVEMEDIIREEKYRRSRESGLNAQEDARVGEQEVTYIYLFRYPFVLYTAKNLNKHLISGGGY